MKNVEILSLIGNPNQNIESQALDLICKYQITPSSDNGYVDFNDLFYDLSMKRSGTQLLIIQENQQVVSTLMGRDFLLHGLNEPYLAVDIRYIATKPEFRHRGFTSRLITALIDENPGVPIFTTHVWRVDFITHDSPPSHIKKYGFDEYSKIQLILQSGIASNDPLELIPQIIHAHYTHTDLGFYLVKSVNEQDLSFNYIYIRQSSNISLDNLGLRINNEGINKINRIKLKL
jgi:GNAT superfamily N-acetyltransferase